MNKKKVRITAVAVAMLMLPSVISACSNNNNGGNVEQPSSSNASSATSTASEESTKPPEETKLNIMLWGDKPKQFDAIVAEFEKQTKDTLNLKLNVTFTPQADYVNKLKLKLAAGEQVDIAFDAPWMNMNTFIAQDNYTNLDPYFNNPKYPGLQKAFGEQILGSNKFTGTDGKLHTYGVPIGRYLGDLGAVYYRKDLAKKYGMSDIQTFDELLAYFDNVLKNDKNVIPFVMKNDGNYGAVAVVEGNKKMPNKPKLGVWDLPLSPNVTANLLINENQVVGISLSGDKLSHISNFPAPLNEKDYSTYETIREWHDKGYIEKEPIIRKDAKGTFTSGKAAAMVEGLSNLEGIDAQLLAGVPNAELGVFLVQQPVRNKVENNPYLITDFRYWNFLCIPKTSVNADRSMSFINWIFEKQANHDLFELGIEGTHWKAVGNDKFAYPEGVDFNQNYNFQGYLMTWNPNYIRLSASVPDSLIEYYRYQADDKSYIKSALTGFAFNQEPIKSELANPDFAKIYDEQLAYKLGMVENPSDGMKNLQQKWENNKKLQVDIETIKAEVKKQVQAYLNSNAVK